jgi:hypothetical protein
VAIEQVGASVKDGVFFLDIRENRKSAEVLIKRQTFAEIAGFEMNFANSYKLHDELDEPSAVKIGKVSTFDKAKTPLDDNAMAFGNQDDGWPAFAGGPGGSLGPGRGY